MSRLDATSDHPNSTLSQPPAGLASIASTWDDTPQVRGAVAFCRSEAARRDTPSEAPEAIRARAYTLARQELPDAPVEDVMCRAETIAKFLKGETA